MKNFVNSVLPVEKFLDVKSMDKADTLALSTSVPGQWRQEKCQGQVSPELTLIWASSCAYSL